MPRYGPRFRDPIFNSRGNLFQTVKEGFQYYSVSFDTKDMIRLVEQETNKLRSPAFYQALGRANLRAAIAVQEGQAESVRTQIGTHGTRGLRPQRPGSRLEMSILHERNRQVYDNNFAVGLESWLSRSPAALYWRSIEEGMEGYTTKAVFTGGATGGYALPNDGGPHMRMIQGRGPRIRVSPIKPFHYSRGGQLAWTRFDMAQAYIEEFRAAGITNVTKDPKGGIFKPSPLD